MKPPTSMTERLAPSPPAAAETAEHARVQVREHAAPLKIMAGLAVIYVVWGSTYFAIRIAIETLPPMTMAGLRWLIAGLPLYVLLRLRGEPIRPPRRQWLAAGVIGSLMLLGGNGLVCWAEQTVASGLAALIVGTVPLWIVLLEWLVFRGTRPTGRMLGGLILGLAGILILVGPRRLGGQPIHLPGGIALLLACAFWALGSLYSRRADLPRSTWLATAMEMILGGAVLLIVGLAVGEAGKLDLAAISLRSVLALGYLVVFGSVVALTTYLWLLQVCLPARVATYAYVNPVIAILLGTLFANEPLSPRVAVAAAVIVAAVVVITRSSARRAR